MRKTFRARYLWIVPLVLLAACSQVPTQPPPVPSAAIASPAPVSTPILSTIEPTPSNALSSLPPLADNWEDRQIFQAGLVKEEQKTPALLPDATVYHLDIQLADDLHSLKGQERVRYTNRATKPLDVIYFQLFPNIEGGKSTVSGVKVDEQAANPVYESENSTVRVPLAVPLDPGQRAVIQLDFQVELPTEAGGNYGLFGFIDNILVLDGFYPAIPVYDSLGWHAGKVPPNADTTFQDASFYVVQVTAPADITLVAAGVEVDRLTMDSHQVVTFAAGPARDFYLAGSDRFTVQSETSGENTVHCYAFKDRTAGCQAAVQTAVAALKSFSARFGDYPYTEFDIVSIPMQFAYGIEYPGIVGINYTLFDLDATINGVATPILLESTVAHEVGHQWFYNVVGNDQANEPWLDEAVTQYVTGLYFLDVYGKNGFDSYRSSWVSRWERVNKELIPIGLPAGSYQGKEYGAIVYGRGPLFLEALAQKMGQAVFDSFLKDYYQTHQWGIGTGIEFKKMAESHCSCDLTAMFNEWVYK